MTDEDLDVLYRHLSDLRIGVYNRSYDYQNSIYKVIKKLQEENEQLLNNWNDLKKWLEDFIKATENDYMQTSTEECKKTQKTIISVFKNVLREMKELEVQSEKN